MLVRWRIYGMLECVSRSCELAALRHATFCCVHMHLRISAVLRCVTPCNVYAVARLRHAPLRNSISRPCMLAVLRHAMLCNIVAHLRTNDLRNAPLCNFLWACDAPARYVLLRSYMRLRIYAVRLCVTPSNVYAVFVDNQKLVDNEEAVMETVSRDDAVVQVVFSRRVVECSQRESADRCLSDPDAMCILQIPEGVKVIDEFAFHDCKSVAVLYIPNSVTAIGKAAFHGCTSLTNVMIPNSVALCLKVQEFLNQQFER
eukprot:s5412_g6.t1